MVQIDNQASVRTLNSELNPAVETEMHFQPWVHLEKTLFASTGTCPGVDSLEVLQGKPITYCFVVTNVGDTYLRGLEVIDAQLGIVLTDSSLLAPGQSVTLQYATLSGQDMTNSALVKANPSDSNGYDLPDMDDVVAADTAELTEIPSGTIIGMVFEDTDGDGRRDAQEPGMPFVKVVISDRFGQMTELRTNGAGFYELLVPAGTAVSDIDESSLHPGYEQTAGSDPSSVNVPVGSSTWIGLDGFQPRGAVFGHIYEDTDGDGMQDATEPDLPYVRVTITDSLGHATQVVASIDGLYSLDVPAGTTMSDIDESSLPSGLVRTAGSDPSSVEVEAGSNTNIGEDGYQPHGTVSGHLYEDKNGNGTQDASEPDLEDVRVLITDGLGQTTELITDGTGRYNKVVPAGSIGLISMRAVWPSVWFGVWARTQPGSKSGLGTRPMWKMATSFVVGYTVISTSTSTPMVSKMTTNRICPTCVWKSRICTPNRLWSSRINEVIIARKSPRERRLWI